MAFFPHVNPGDQFKPSVLLENNIRDVVNSFNTTGEIPVARTSANSCRLPCWNNNNYAIPSGASVEIDINGAWAGDVPQVRFAEANSEVWGIAIDRIEPNGIGAVLFSGVITLNLTADKGVNFISPDGDGGYMESDFGAAVLANNGKKLVVLLGGAGGSCYNHNAPYALNFDSVNQIITVNSGYINLNGVFRMVPSNSLIPQTGIVCVHSELASDGSGDWSEPEILYAIPDKNSYPVGEVTVSENGGVAVNSYPVSVAVIIDTEKCPYGVY